MCFLGKKIKPAYIRWFKKKVPLFYSNALALKEFLNAWKAPNEGKIIEILGPDKMNSKEQNGYKSITRTLKMTLADKEIKNGEYRSYTR